MSVENGVVMNWDDHEKILHHAFYNELRIAPEDQPVIMLEDPSNPRENREKITEIAFETFRLPYFYLQVDAVCALMSTGKTNGTVIDFGDSKTNIVPVFDLHALRDSYERLEIGGRDVTDYLIKLLNEQGNSFTTSAERSIVVDIKEKLCFIADDYDTKALKNEDSEQWELPDGSFISLSNERFEAPEIYFQPDIIELESLSLDDLVIDSIKKCDVSLRKNLMNNIVLTGGSNFKGTKVRLELELESKYSNKFVIESTIESKSATWIGASILSTVLPLKSYISNEG